MMTANAVPTSMPAPNKLIRLLLFSRFWNSEQLISNLLLNLSMNRKFKHFFSKCNIVMTENNNSINEFTMEKYTFFSNRIDTNFRHYLK